MSISGISAVDTKRTPRRRFDNYGSARDATVDTKKAAGVSFGNYTGFVRVRRRKTLRRGKSASFDLVQAVRVNGQPRHNFLLGLGSQKEKLSGCGFFWLRAIGRMTRYGLDKQQRCRLVMEMVRKGARLPTIEECKCWMRMEWAKARLTEIVHIIESAQV